VYITEQQVADLLDMDTAIGCVEESMRQVAAGEASVLPRRRARIKDGLFHLLGGASVKDGVHGVKAYTTHQGAARFYVFLFAATGELLATIEADYLGRIRTGAASGVATRFMARKGASRVLLMGSGSQATSQACALAAVMQIENLDVWSRTAERRESFAAELRDQHALPAMAVEDPRSAALRADVITTVTTAVEPILEASWIAPGTHINACGSNSLKRVELDPFVFEKAELVCVDNLEQARLEAGDLDNAIRNGFFGWDRLVQLPQIVSGDIDARLSDDDITVFESQGLGIWDVACAKVVYDKARKLQD